MQLASINDGFTAGILSDEYLLERYLPEPMERYFTKKLPELDRGELLARIAECLKGLVLMSPGVILFSDEVDAIWHYWILQTEQYAELCAKLPDGRFHHHSSTDYPVPLTPPLDDKCEVDRLIGFFASYVQNFGAMEQGRLRYWPALESLMNALRWDLLRTNAFLDDKARVFETTLEQIKTPWVEAGDPETGPIARSDNEGP